VHFQILAAFMGESYSEGGRGTGMHALRAVAETLLLQKLGNKRGGAGGGLLVQWGLSACVVVEARF
jgi:hypothetical protein